MSQKKQAWKFGRFAEKLAAWHLWIREYRIVARGFRSTVGEINIVAQRGQVLAFVEAKARKNLDAAAQSLRLCQAGHIVRAAGAFIQSRSALSALYQRFDVILVVPWKLPVHLGDAWRSEL